MALHSAYEIPQLSDDFIYVPLQQQIFISVKPKMITTSNRLRGYEPHDRGCFFKTERRLRFFKSYSQSKCELECLSNFTKNECGCVRFWMPSKSFGSWNFPTNSKRISTLKISKCKFIKIINSRR